MLVIVLLMRFSCDIFVLQIFFCLGGGGNSFVFNIPFHDCLISLSAVMVWMDG